MSQGSLVKLDVLGCGGGHGRRRQVQLARGRRQEAGDHNARQRVWINIARAGRRRRTST